MSESQRNKRCEVCGELMPLAIERTKGPYRWLCSECDDHQPATWPGCHPVESTEINYHGGRFHSAEW